MRLTSSQKCHSVYCYLCLENITLPPNDTLCLGRSMETLNISSRLKNKVHRLSYNKVHTNSKGDLKRMQQVTTKTKQK